MKDRAEPKLLTPAAERQERVLESFSISAIAEHLARRINLPDGEIRLAVKAGRYQRSEVLLATSALPR